MRLLHHRGHWSCRASGPAPCGPPAGSMRCGQAACTECEGTPHTVHTATAATRCLIKRRNGVTAPLGRAGHDLLLRVIVAPRFACCAAGDDQGRGVGARARECVVRFGPLAFGVTGLACGRCSRSTAHDAAPGEGFDGPGVARLLARLPAAPLRRPHRPVDRGGQRPRPLGSAHRALTRPRQPPAFSGIDGARSRPRPALEAGPTRPRKSHLAFIHVCLRTSHSAAARLDRRGRRMASGRRSLDGP